MNHRADANQKMIVKGLRAAGASVVVLAGVGRGVCDLLAGWRGMNLLLEVKNLAGRGDRLTPDEAEFLSSWQGQATIIHSLDEALEILKEVSIHKETGKE
jgi:hypothetical protein